MMSIVIVLVVLYILVKGSLKGKKSGIKGKFFLIPALFLYYLGESIMKIHSINREFIGFSVLAVILGIGFGVFRAKFYKCGIDEEGEGFYKRHILDVVIIVFYVGFETFVRFFVQTYDNSFLNLNVILLLLGTISIIVRRAVIYLKIMRLKEKRIRSLT